MYFITIKRMLEVCFSAHPNIQYRAKFNNTASERMGKPVRSFFYQKWRKITWKKQM